MIKQQCPTCNYTFTHTVGMEYCPDKCSAVDYNSGSEMDMKHARLVGDIAKESIDVRD